MEWTLTMNQKQQQKRPNHSALKMQPHGTTPRQLPYRFQQWPSFLPTPHAAWRSPCFTVLCLRSCFVWTCPQVAPPFITRQFERAQMLNFWLQAGPQIFISGQSYPKVTETQMVSTVLATKFFLAEVKVTKIASCNRQSR